MNKSIKILSIITAVALLLCLMQMPYGYYTLVRFLTAVTLCLLAHNRFMAGQKELCIVCCAMVLLFQPFFKLHLGRVLWNVMDVATAVFLVVILLRNAHSS